MDHQGLAVVSGTATSGQTFEFTRRASGVQENPPLDRSTDSSAALGEGRKDRREGVRGVATFSLQGVLTGIPLPL